MTPENMIAVMLRKKASWIRVSNLIKRIMNIREAEERKN